MWEAWLPKPTDCVIGQGLVDADGNPVDIGINAVACDWCPVGRRSVTTDEKNRTCEKCDAGKFSNQQGQTQCVACSPGRFSDLQGAVECSECPVGTYADTVQQQNCTTCVEVGRADFHRWSTFANVSGQLRISSAATSQEQCRCTEGYWESADRTCEECTCASCPESMACELETPSSAYFVIPSTMFCFIRVLHAVWH